MDKQPSKSVIMILVIIPTAAILSALSGCIPSLLH